MDYEFVLPEHKFHKYLIYYILLLNQNKGTIALHYTDAQGTYAINGLHQLRLLVLMMSS